MLVSMRNLLVEIVSLDVLELSELKHVLFALVLMMFVMPLWWILNT